MKKALSNCLSFSYISSNSRYLTTQEAISGADLDAIIRAAELYVPVLVRERFLPGFPGLFDETLDLSELLRLAKRIERDEQILIRKQGYACLRAIKGYACYFADKNGLRLEDYLPLEDEHDYPVPDEDLDIHEGREYEVRGIRYERDKEARRKCIDYYGFRCQACVMSFEEIYGEIGRGFI